MFVSLAKAMGPSSLKGYIFKPSGPGALWLLNDIIQVLTLSGVMKSAAGSSRSATPLDINSLTLSLGPFRLSGK